MESVPTWVAVVTAIFAVFSGPASAAAVWLWAQRKASRKDTIAEYKDLLDAKTKQYEDLLDVERKRCDEAIAGLTIRVTEADRYIKILLDRVGKAEVVAARAEGEIKRLESDNRGLYERMRLMQERMHSSAPGVIRPCTIIASIPEGVIHHVSIEAGSMFHYNPDELMGKPITLLMPRDVRPLHKRAMEKMIQEGRQADPSKPVPTYGITKDGQRFPIYVSLSGPWEVIEPGMDMRVVRCVNADIVRRGDSDTFSVIPHGPTTRNPDETPTIKAPPATT